MHSTCTGSEGNSVELALFFPAYMGLRDTTQVSRLSHITGQQYVSILSYLCIYYVLLCA